MVCFTESQADSKRGHQRGGAPQHPYLMSNGKGGGPMAPPPPTTSGAHGFPYNIPPQPPKAQAQGHNHQGAHDDSRNQQRSAKYQQSSLPPNLQQGRSNNNNNNNNNSNGNPFVTDAEKVRHVVEVTNVNSADLETQSQILQMLTRNQLSYLNVVGAKGRTFIMFDRPKTGMFEYV